VNGHALTPFAAARRLPLPIRLSRHLAEVPAPEIQYAAACPMHYPGQQDEGKDDQN